MRGFAADTGHQMLLLEGRYSEAVLTAAACRHGASTLFDLPLGSLWGNLKGRIELEWL